MPRLSSLWDDVGEVQVRVSAVVRKAPGILDRWSPLLNTQLLHPVQFNLCQWSQGFSEWITIIGFNSGRGCFLYTPDRLHTGFFCLDDREEETQQEIHLCKLEKSWAKSHKHWALIQGELLLTLWHLGSPHCTSQPEAYQVESLSYLPDKAAGPRHTQTHIQSPFLLPLTPGQIKIQVIMLLRYGL